MLSTIPRGRSIDMRGTTWGRLSVPANAEPISVDKHLHWPCTCECGTIGHLVRGTKLRTGKIVSCGCWRADPDIRQAARMSMPAKRRKQIAMMGGAATSKKWR